MEKWQNAPEGYSPEIMVTLEKLDKRIVLSIRDNGEGMGPEVKRKLFDSFFTTKPVGQGTGLGMAIVRDIIENKHHGKYCLIRSCMNILVSGLSFLSHETLSAIYPLLLWGCATVSSAGG